MGTTKEKQSEQIYLNGITFKGDLKELLKLTPQEKVALQAILDWEKQSAKSNWIVGGNPIKPGDKVTTMHTNLYQERFCHAIKGLSSRKAYKE